MRTRRDILARLLFAGIVLGGLTFGAVQALTAVPRSDPCQPCPYPSQQECITCCQKELGFEDGYCTPVGDCLCM